MYFQYTLVLLVIMKILLTLFVLLFSPSVLAEDISDFQIEGISIGDSLLDYFSDEEIKNNIMKVFRIKVLLLLNSISILRLKLMKVFNLILKEMIKIIKYTQ